MTPALPRITAKQIIPVLERRGFVFTRGSGSHRIYRNATGRRVTVPFHTGKTLHPKTLKSILKDADMTVEELINEL